MTGGRRRVPNRANHQRIPSMRSTAMTLCCPRFSGNSYGVPSKFIACSIASCKAYPFGTFLYWRVSPETSDKFNFYDFVLNYHERDNRHCPALPLMPNQTVDSSARRTATPDCSEYRPTRKHGMEATTITVEQPRCIPCSSALLGSALAAR